MCDRWVELRAALTRLAGDLDPERMTSADADRILAEAAAIERSAAAVTIRLAPLAARSAATQQSGEPTPAHRLARQTGLGIGAAVRRMQTGQRLAQQPKLAAAGAAGELSSEQLAVVSQAAAADPTAEDRLLDVAERHSLSELARECDRVRAAADRDADARRQRIYAARSLRHWVGDDGTGHLHLRHNPENIAEVMALLEPARRELARAGSRAGVPARSDALDADALVATLRARFTGRVQPPAPPRPVALPEPQHRDDPVDDASYGGGDLDDASYGGGDLDDDEPALPPDLLTWPEPESGSPDRTGAATARGP
jgi:hypothetical protein